MLETQIRKVGEVAYHIRGVVSGERAKVATQLGLSLSLLIGSGGLIHSGINSLHPTPSVSPEMRRSSLSLPISEDSSSEDRSDDYDMEWLAARPAEGEHRYGLPLGLGRGYVLQEGQTKPCENVSDFMWQNPVHRAQLISRKVVRVEWTGNYTMRDLVGEGSLVRQSFMAPDGSYVDIDSPQAGVVRIGGTERTTQQIPPDSLVVTANLVTADGTIVEKVAIDCTCGNKCECKPTTPTATPTKPGETATPTGTATNVPTIKFAESPTPTNTAVPNRAPETTPTMTATITVTSTVTSGTPTGTSVFASPTPTGTPIPTPFITPRASETPTPIPTLTSSIPTFTPTSTPWRATSTPETRATSTPTIPTITPTATPWIVTATPETRATSTPTILTITPTATPWRATATPDIRPTLTPLPTIRPNSPTPAPTNTHAPMPTATRTIGLVVPTIRPESPTPAPTNTHAPMPTATRTLATATPAR